MQTRLSDSKLAEIINNLSESDLYKYKKITKAGWQKTPPSRMFNDLDVLDSTDIATYVGLYEKLLDDFSYFPVKKINGTYEFCNEVPDEFAQKLQPIFANIKTLALKGCSELLDGKGKLRWDIITLLDWWQFSTIHQEKNIFAAVASFVSTAYEQIILKITYDIAKSQAVNLPLTPIYIATTKLLNASLGSIVEDTIATTQKKDPFMENAADFARQLASIDAQTFQEHKEKFKSLMHHDIAATIYRIVKERQIDNKTIVDINFVPLIPLRTLRMNFWCNVMFDCLFVHHSFEIFKMIFTIFEETFGKEVNSTANTPMLGKDIFIDDHTYNKYILCKKNLLKSFRRSATLKERNFEFKASPLQKDQNIIETIFNITTQKATELLLENYHQAHVRELVSAQIYTEFLRASLPPSLRGTWENLYKKNRQYNKSIASCVEKINRSLATAKSTDEIFEEIDRKNPEIEQELSDKLLLSKRLWEDTQEKIYQYCEAKKTYAEFIKDFMQHFKQNFFQLSKNNQHPVTLLNALASLINIEFFIWHSLTDSEELTLLNHYTPKRPSASKHFFYQHGYPTYVPLNVVTLEKEQEDKVVSVSAEEFAKPFLRLLNINDAIWLSNEIQNKYFSTPLVSRSEDEIKIIKELIDFVSLVKNTSQPISALDILKSLHIKCFNMTLSEGELCTILKETMHKLADHEIREERVDFSKLSNLTKPRSLSTQARSTSPIHSQSLPKSTLRARALTTHEQIKQKLQSISKNQLDSVEEQPAITKSKIKAKPFNAKITAKADLAFNQFNPNENLNFFNEEKSAVVISPSQNKKDVSGLIKYFNGTRR